MTRIVLAFLIGMCLAAASTSVPSPLCLLAGLPCLLAIRHGRLPLLLLALISGFAWLSVHAEDYLSTRQQLAAHPETIWLEGRVQGLATRSGDLLRFRFALTDTLPEWRQAGNPPLLSVSWKSPLSFVQAGERLRLRLRLRPPRGLANPAGFDSERWHMSQGIHAQAWVLAAEPVTDQPVSGMLIDQLHRLRQQLAAHIRGHTDGAAAAILPALAVADRSGLDDQHWRVLSATGTSHLLAISGLHIGLVAAAGYLIGGFFFSIRRSAQGRFWRHDLAALLAFLMALSYSALAGFSVSTVRATVMLTAVLAALVLRHRLGAGHALVFALLVVLLLEPFAPLKVGFWLSFAAVACLLAGFHGRPVSGKRMTRWWRAQIVIFLGLGPVILLLGSSLSLLAPVANLIAIPLTGLLVVPPLLLALALMGVAPDLANLLLDFAALGCESLWWLLSGMASWPVAQLSMALFWPILLAALIGSGLLLAPRGFPGRLAGSLVLASAVMGSTVTRQIEAGELELHVIDVGQGLAVLIRTRNHALLYDSGPVSRTGWNAGAKVVVPYLQQLGLPGIDRLVSSHGDADHAGGVEPVLSWSGVQTSHYSSAALEGAVPCRQGDAWNWDGVRFEFLHPTPFLPYLGNDSSCVLLLSTSDSQLLLPGDVSAIVEAGLVRQYGHLRLDLIVVPHHGSKTSSSSVLLSRFKPKVAVVSSAYRNRFGMPHQEVVRRYRSHGSRLLNTADCGRLLFATGNSTGLMINAAQRPLHGGVWRGADHCNWRRRGPQK